MGELKPYYQDDAVTIYHGDCLEIMPLLEAKIDLVLTDPPYNHYDTGGVEIKRGRKKEYKTIKEKWDNEFKPRDIFGWLYDKQSLVFCSFILLDEWLRLAKETDCLRQLLAMEQKNPIPTIRPLYCHSLQYILWLNPKGKTPIFNGKGHGSLFSYINQECHGLHPARKPLSVIKALVSNHSDTDNLVVDPFMGSGTTLRAAKDLGRKAIGIEIEEKYCEIAANRCRQEVLNLGS